MSIEAAFDGRVGGPIMVRHTNKGKRWISVSLATDTGGDKPEWVSVAAFDDVAASIPEDLNKGERCYCEGRLKVSRYADKHGEQRANLQLTASRFLVLDRIGRRARRRRIKADQQDGGNVVPMSGDPMDRDIPFDEPGAAA